jgi:putative protease
MDVSIMAKPELLAPAGNPEKLKYAAAYGADAVYFGAKFGSLRSFAGNFDFEQAAAAIDYIHERGKKAYITLNIYPFTEEYPKLLDTAERLDSLRPDAFIVADIGVLSELNNRSLKTPIHISTQANVTSSQAALAFGELGAKRVNLARELSLKQIKRIQSDIESEIETEVFIHGSVCFSYSGRCAISDYMTGFRANHGECKHPCRWKYHLVEQKRPGEYYPVAEDDRGLYFFNSRELALFEYVPELADAGVASFKIEGRMKSIHYIATTVSFYRKVIDGERFDWQAGLEQLSRIPNRGYSRGFMKGSVQPEDYKLEDNESKSQSRMVANVTEQKIDDKPVLNIRNKITGGETLELLTPDGRLSEFEAPETFTTIAGEQLAEVNNHLSIILAQPLPPFSILRRTSSPQKH